MNEPNVRVELITPDKAREYLGRNTHNRKLRANVVDAYARDMAAGAWDWNGESIKFDTDGVLIDGQHRLHAIVKSRKAVRILVIRDLPHGTQDTVDGGAKRTFADVLALKGEKNYTTLAASVRAITAWEHGGSAGTSSLASRSFTNAELFITLDKYPWVRDGMPGINRVASSAHLPSSVSGLCWWLFTQIDAEDANGFYDRLASDLDHQAGEPIYALRRLLKDSHDDYRGTRNTKFLTAVTIKSWNKYRAGESCALLKFRVGGANPERFPEPR